MSESLRRKEFQGLGYHPEIPDDGAVTSKGLLAVGATFEEIGKTIAAVTLPTV